MWSLTFWRGATERAIASGAQGMLAIIGVATLPNDWVVADWPGILMGGLFTAGLSVLKSLAALSANGTPSLGGGEMIPPTIPHGRHGA